jgi:leader peptidase (prepilin peptidase)/N-methyltransferase
MVEKVVIIVLFGLAWGSFLNVVIYRLPLGRSLLKPPSSCPQCKRQIKFYDNIPVLSYVFLGGKCRHCQAKIPLTYLLVEILIPLSFVLVFQHHGSSISLSFFASCFFASALIVLGFIDYYHQILPDEITLPGLVLALVYAPFRSDLNLKQALIGAVVGAGFLLFVYGAYYLVRKKEGLGMGDVTLMLLIGAYLGWRLTLFTLILASFAGAVIGVFLILVKKKDFQYSLPFGTFLAPAAFFSLLWGEPILRAYLDLFKTQ